MGRSDSARRRSRLPDTSVSSTAAEWRSLRRRFGPIANSGTRVSRRDTLSVTDNRTGKQYEIPIANSTIRAVDLRQIRVDPDEFGMMSYDPAFLNTAACQSRITFIDGDKGVLLYRGYPSSSLLRKARSSRQHTCC